MVSLPDDDPDALKIVLLVVHYNFQPVPKTVPHELLLNLVVLAEKYGIISSLKPFWKDWYAGISATDKSSTYLKERPARLGQRLWIFLTLGATRGFIIAVIELLLHANSTVDGHLFLPGSKPGEEYYLDCDQYIQLSNILGA